MKDFEKIREQITTLEMNVLTGKLNKTELEALRQRVKVLMDDVETLIKNRELIYEE